jgi:type I restriction-modification system DNA methylase subunit
MNGAQHAKIVSFIWGIADDVLRDLYVRGKYRDVILPMTVLRRLDAVLEPTKDAVAYQVYDTAQVNELAAFYLGGADRDKLDPILDACVATFKEDLDEDGQVDFKGKAKAFVRTYETEQAGAGSEK